MLIFNIVLALVLMSNTHLSARIISPSLEDSGTMKSVKRLGQGHQKMEKQGKGRRAQGAPSHQGQASSSAYAREDFTIQIDIASRDHPELTTGQREGGDPSTSHKDPAQHKFSTASGFSAKPISAAALNTAKAQHELKKKLQAENKKKFQLHDISGEKGPKDPREDLLTELMKASQDIEK